MGEISDVVSKETAFACAFFTGILPDSEYKVQIRNKYGEFVELDLEVREGKYIFKRLEK